MGAHEDRNPGRQGDADGTVEPSRYHQLYSLLDQAARPKTLFMLTATPINNRLSDFRHMAELFTRRDEAYFARTLGVNNLVAEFVEVLGARIMKPQAELAAVICGKRHPLIGTNKYYNVTLSWQ